MVAYLAIAFFLTALLTLKSKAAAIISFAVGTMAMTVCLTYSMCKLKKQSQILDHLGIKFSKGLFNVHLGSFWVALGLTGNGAC